MCKRIDALTPADLLRVARRVVYGEDTVSPLSYEGHEHWQRTGDGSPTVLVYGPLFGEKDALWNVEREVGSWGLGRSGSMTGKASASSSGKSWFGR
jgi:hypothetical protein